MGDDELNFTEEEAASWKDDPRNQAHGLSAVTSSALACVLLLAAMIALVLVAGFASSGREDVNHVGEPHGGTALVR
ncbi:MAG TPA: hypothetical protein VMA31_14200 [Bryobacteraceae bacterium]|nr:hypothetical protein [Bryobacteraceae bacterium]